MDEPRRSIPLKRKVVFAGLVLLFVFVGMECLLRIIGFDASQDVERMAFTFPVDEYNENSPQPFLQRDDLLFWKPRPNVLGHNSIGFYGPEFSVEKPEGVYRIVCLGDSCTHYGPISYPDMLRAMLDKLAPNQFEVINAGCIGYTSHQGLNLLNQSVLKWEPDLVTVYFGWNDHWLARGLEDKNQSVIEPSAVAGWLGKIRLIQLAGYLKSADQISTAPKMRVEQSDYRSNLQQIVKATQKEDAETWLLTAPHAFNHGIPPYLVTSGEVRNPDALIPLHQRYNDIVREVGREAKVQVLDFEAQMDAMDKSKLFIEDHIHLSEDGRLLVAQAMVQQLQQAGILRVAMDSGEAEKAASESE